MLQRHMATQMIPLPPLHASFVRTAACGTLVAAPPDPGLRMLDSLSDNRRFVIRGVGLSRLLMAFARAHFARVRGRVVIPTITGSQHERLSRNNGRFA